MPSLSSFPHPARFRNLLIAAVDRTEESPWQLESAARLADADGAAVALDEYVPALARRTLPGGSERISRARQIVRRATTGGHDLVVVAPGSSWRGQRTVQELAAVCPTSLLTLNVPMMNGDVVVLVDPLDRIEVNRAALAQASAHAHRTQGVVHVLYASSHANAGPAWRRRSALFDLVQRLGLDGGYELHLAALEPAVAATRLADIVEAPLVVVGATATEGPQAMSAAAQQLVASSLHSVLIARPANFDGEVPRSHQRFGTPCTASQHAEMVSSV